MSKLLFICFICLSSLPSNAQSGKSALTQKIKAFIKANSVLSGKNPVIYFNNVDKIIDIDGYRIPLNEVKTTYNYHQTSYGHCVDFDCRSGNCITQADGSGAIGFAVAFKTKKNCYDFIDLISQLKK